MSGSGTVRGLARLAAALALLGAAGAGCGDADVPPSALGSPKVTVALEDGHYDPARVRIEPGTRVTFVGRSPAIHTAETDGVAAFETDLAKLDRQNRFDTHIIRRGEAESVEFDTPGRYRFHSSLDSEMRGVIEVVGPSGIGDGRDRQ
jgi:plastocyanin